MPPSHIAVLGGGLTGLSSIFHLARRFPNSSITLIERTNRLGGWVRSERVEVQDENGAKADILLEMGPRTLRPNGKSVLELINLLDLQPHLLTVPKTSPAAQNRFLHIPATDGLTLIPSSPFALLTSPLAKVLLPAIFKEPFRLHPHFSPNSDESVDAFLTSRFGEEFARTFGSALVHGIYAADSKELSVKAAFAPLWELAKGGGGSIGRGILKRSFGIGETQGVREKEMYELGNVEELMQGVSVYSFKDGMETLVCAIERELGQRQNVKIVKGVQVSNISRPAFGDDPFKLWHSPTEHVAASHVVSALPLHALHSLLRPEDSSPPSELSHLTYNPSSSVTLVNLIFPPTPTPIHPPGFGYLVPRPRSSSSEEQEDVAVNGYQVLGTVFDSCALGGQDHYPNLSSPDSKNQFTKMTMMLRSHHPNQSHTTALSESALLSILSKHLFIPPNTSLPKPALVRINNLRQCIPTPTVGHIQRIEELRKSIGEVGNGRLEIVGAGVGGVSVPDCVEQGRKVGRDW